MSTPYCCEGCGKTSRIAPHLPGCPVAAAWAAEVPEVIAVSLSDDQIRREHERRQRAAREAAAQAESHRLALERDMQAGKDAEFAARFGLTYDQFLDIQDYCRDKFEADR